MFKTCEDIQTRIAQFADQKKQPKKYLRIEIDPTSHPNH